MTTGTTTTTDRRQPLPTSAAAAPTAFPCDLCGATARQVIAPYTACHRLVRCRVCGLIFVDPPLATDTATYDQRYFFSTAPDQFGYADYHSCAAAPVYSAMLDAVEQYGIPHTGLLDIGCAAGHLLRVARQRDWTDLNGTDLSSCFAAQLAVEEFSFSCGDFCSLSFSRTFNAITAIDVLEHCRSPRLFLQHCRSILNPDGILAMIVPDDFANLPARFTPPDLALAKLPEHLFYFSPTTLSRLVTTCGFAVLDFCTYEVKFDKFVPALRRGYSPAQLRARQQLFYQRHPSVARVLESLVRQTNTGGTMRLIARAATQP